MHHDSNMHVGRQRDKYRMNDERYDKIKTVREKNTKKKPQIRVCITTKPRLSHMIYCKMMTRTACNDDELQEKKSKQHE